jgi:hypothetical protein
MSENVIERWAAVQQINTGVACTIEYVECNVKKGTGGKLVKLTNWARLTKDVKVDGVAGHFESNETWERQRNTLDKEIIILYNPTNTMQHPRPVHYWLLCSFNGKRIV